MLRLVISTALLAATAATLSADPTFAGVTERSRSGNSQEKGESQGNQSGYDEGLYPYRESSADELAAAVRGDLGQKQHDGNYVNEQPRQSSDDRWRNAVPGTPGTDYPNYESIPETSFTCVDKEPGGYYADAETGCQVFHVCNTGGVKSSFLCPPGSIFNQRYFVCDWWYGFDCDEAVDLYFKKSEQSLEHPNNKTTNSGDGESEKRTRVYENIQVHDQVFDPLLPKFSDNSWVRNPTNDLSLASSGRGTVGYPNRESSRMDHLSSDSDANNVNVAPIDSGNPRKQDDSPINEKTPRGFSRHDNRSYVKEKKVDRTTSLHDLTNDLASYVNYFEAASDNNNNNNNYKNENSGAHSVVVGSETKSWMNDASFRDKYVGYGERTKSGYSSSSDDDPYESWVNIEEDE